MSKINLIKRITSGILILLLAFSVNIYAGNCSISAINKSDVEQAQVEWAKDVIGIGKVYQDETAYKLAAKNLVDSLYDYQNGTVLFKPTKAKDTPFRKTAKSAIAYFVGHNKNFAEDKGFALAPWVKITFKNSGMYFHGDMAIVMGEYVFTAKSGESVKVEYTFGYVKDPSGKLRIVLHHSSLPYGG